LLLPLISFAVYLLDLSMPSWEVSSTDDSTSMLQLPSATTELSLKPFSHIIFVASIAITLIPRIVAYGMTAYVGICAGYVGLVHLRLVRTRRNLVDDGYCRSSSSVTALSF
jgi:hypothetical protein